MKKAVVTGIFGQDGSYLTEILYNKGYEVHGIIRKPLSQNTKRIAQYLFGKEIKIHTHEIDLNEYRDVVKLLAELKPDECYHLAATHYSSSTSQGERKKIACTLYENNIRSASHLIHGINEVSPKTRLVLAGSCLMFDGTSQSPQTELTPYQSNSLYGLSKIAAAELARFYRDTENMHFSTVILYNHESPRRGSSFVTQKIAEQVVLIKEKQKKEIVLGNMDSQKDWGYAKDYAYGMWLMAQADSPDDYILSTGVTHTVEDFLRLAFQAVNITGWKNYIRLEPSYTSVGQAQLIGNADKAYRKLGWKHTIKFDELVTLMVQSVALHTLD